MKNLWLRIIVAALGIPLLILSMKSSEWTRGALILILQLLMLREWRLLSFRNGAPLFIPATLIALAGINVGVFTYGSAIGTAIGIFCLAVMFIIEILRPTRQPLRALGGSTLYLIYIALPLALWYNLDTLDVHQRFAPIGAVILLWLSTWACDTAAFFSGSTIGKHKLHPAASPNKTIEGFIAGIIGAAIPLLVVNSLGWSSPTILDVIVLTVSVGLIGQGGDLLESLMKREAGVKDTASILPGHGGLLDRFDSLLLSTPVFYAYLLLSGA